MRLHRLVCALAVMAMLSSCTTFSGGGKNELVRDGKFYTKVNMWYSKKGEIPSTNYHIGEMLPAGTMVKIVKCSGGTISFETESGNRYELQHEKRHSRISFEELFDRHFGQGDITGGGGIYSDLSPREQEGVDGGRPAIGMRRDAVLMAFGYPPSHRTPDLAADQWIYWVGRQVVTVVFDNDTVSRIDGVESTRGIKLYVVSDPPGAMIEADGKSAGKAPCIVNIELGPRDTTRKIVFRASPAKLDAPRLGVLCDAPMSSESLAGDPVTVREVIPLSSGHKLGLVPGDRILTVNGTQIRNEFDCMDAIRKAGFGKPLRMEIRRGGRDMSLLGRTDLQESGSFYAKEKELAASTLADMDGKVVFFDLRSRTDGAGMRVTTQPATSAAVAAGVGRIEDHTPSDDGTLLDLPMVASGFLVTKQGHVLTCGSALSDAREVVIITAAGEKHAASVVHMDQVNDWCLLKAATLSGTPLPVAGEAGISKGLRVFRLGYPLDESDRNTLDVAGGNVADPQGFGGDPRHLQVKIGGQARNFSGAPIVNTQGEWLGIVSDRLDKIIHAFAGATEEDVHFLLSAKTIVGLLPDTVRLPSGAVLPGPELDGAGIRKQASGAVVTVHAK